MEIAITSAVEELKATIKSLPENEYTKLRNWFTDRDWEKWDGKIIKDFELGKLDFLVKEALEEKSKGNLKVL